MNITWISGLLAVFIDDGFASASFAPILVEQFVRRLSPNNEGRIKFDWREIRSGIKLHLDLANIKAAQKLLFDLPIIETDNQTDRWNRMHGRPFQI